jgi:hypothetical protein
LKEHSYGNESHQVSVEMEDKMLSKKLLCRSALESILIIFFLEIISLDAKFTYDKVFILSQTKMFWKNLQKELFDEYKFKPNALRQKKVKY